MLRPTLNIVVVGLLAACPAGSVSAQAPPATAPAPAQQDGGITLTNSCTLTINGAIDADGSVIQNGAGTTVLNADISTTRDLVRFNQQVKLGGTGATRTINTLTGSSSAGTIEFLAGMQGAGKTLSLQMPNASGDILFQGTSSNLVGLTVTDTRKFTSTGSITTTSPSC